MDDYAHDFAHIDHYNIDGETLKKELHLTYAESLTLADEDINMNWKGLRFCWQGELRMLQVHRIIVAV